MIFLDDLLIWTFTKLIFFYLNQKLQLKTDISVTETKS